MALLFLFALAIVMAIFGIIGNQRGLVPTLIALVFLLGAFILTERMPETLLALLNQMYRTFALLLTGGAADFASGDFEALAGRLKDIEVPFKGENARFGLLIVIGGAVLFGWWTAAVFGKRIKRAKSPGWGLVAGLAYGYLLCAAVLPLLFNMPGGLLPVPFIRSADPAATLQALEQRPASVGAGRVWESLSQPGTIQLLSLIIAVGMALILILSIRRSTKRG